jgi:hypothetical protein
MIKWILVTLGLIFLVGVFGTALFVLHGLLVFLVVVVALVLLIGIGNYLNSVLGIKYKAQQFNNPRRDRDEASDEAP